MPYGGSSSPLGESHGSSNSEFCLDASPTCLQGFKRQCVKKKKHSMDMSTATCGCELKKLFHYETISLITKPKKCNVQGQTARRCLYP